MKGAWVVGRSFLDWTTKHALMHHRPNATAQNRRKLPTWDTTESEEERVSLGHEPALLNYAV